VAAGSTGGDSTGSTGGDSTGSTGAGSTTGSGTTSGSSGSTGGSSGGATYTLSVDNYLVWCSVEADGVPLVFSRSNEVTSVDFPAGSVVTLSGDALSGFVWGYWTGTDGDTGAFDRNMVTTVTMDGDKSVLACCPFPPPASQTCP
jgi:hypothetical protein